MSVVAAVTPISAEQLRAVLEPVLPWLSGLAELRAAWSATLPALFGAPEVTVGSIPAGTVPTS